MCVVLIEIDSTLGNINVSWFVTSGFKLSIIQAPEIIQGYKLRRGEG